MGQLHKAMSCPPPPLQNLSPWVGLRKINVSYWGWEDASPFTNSSLRWLPGEPSDSGFCAYLERAQVAALKANPCTATTDGLICEKPAGEDGTQQFSFVPSSFSNLPQRVPFLQLLLPSVRNNNERL